MILKQYTSICGLLAWLGLTVPIGPILSDDLGSEIKYVYVELINVNVRKRLRICVSDSFSH